MKVVDNFLPSSYQDALEETLLSGRFPWYFNLDTLGADYSKFPSTKTTEAPQFTHVFISDGVVRSEYFQLVSMLGYHLMLTENLDTTHVLRIKSNLNTPINNYPLGNHFAVHLDYEQDSITCIYYVNDSDGDTILFNKDGTEEVKRISPKKGRLVYFDSKTPHAGCPPKVQNTRCVINFNFAIKEIK